MTEYQGPDLTKIKQVTSVNGPSQAQELLDSGWLLLTTCRRRDGADEYVEYHLGKLKTLPKQHGMLT